MAGQSTLRYNNYEESDLTIESIWPPAITFVRPKGKKQDKKAKTTDAGDDNNNKDDDDNDVKVRGFKIKLIPGIRMSRTPTW